MAWAARLYSNRSEVARAVRLYSKCSEEACAARHYSNRSEVAWAGGRGAAGKIVYRRFLRKLGFINQVSRDFGEKGFFLPDWRLITVRRIGL